MAEFEHDIYSDPGDPDQPPPTDDHETIEDTQATVRDSDTVGPEDDREPGQDRFMLDRCDPCKTRGQRSKCDRRWPTCSKCRREGTEAGCYAASEAIDPLPAIPRVISPAPPPPPSAAIRPPRPLRLDHGPALRRAASAAPILQHPPVGRILVPNTPPHGAQRTKPAPTLVRAPRRSRSPPRPPPSIRDSPRIRSPPPLHPDADINAAGTLANAQVAFLREALAAAESKARELNTLTGPSANNVPGLAHTPDVPMGTPIDAGGSLGGRQVPAMIPGHIGARTFAIIPDAVKRQFTGPHGWCSHVSLRYFTDEYCEAAHKHAALNEGMSFNLDTNRWEKAPAELPDLDEDNISSAQWMRAWQRFLGFLRAINHPNAERWQAHYSLITGERDFFDNFPKWRSYCIAVRRRSLQEGIDPSVLQRGIMEPIAIEYERNKTLSAVRQLVAGSSRHPDPFPAQGSRLPRSASTPTLRQPAQPPTHSQAHPIASTTPPKGKCFICGARSHQSTECSGTSLPNGDPLLVQTSTAGPPLINAGNISAPCAAPRRMAPRAARSDPRRVVTPLLADKWEDAIRQAGIENEFSDVPIGLRVGFRLGTSSVLASTTVHKNHLSATNNPSVIENHIQAELAAGRYSGPFTLHDLNACIGHFRASPLGVVDKPSAPGSFRVIQDFSFPVHDEGGAASVNSEIDPNQFTCLWGFFSDVVDIILALPRGSQAATFDVDAAYRRMPVHPLDQPHIIVHWQGNFYVDHCVPFGATSSNGIFGRCGDCILAIFRSLGVQHAVKWVDDFCFFRVPASPTTAHPTYDLDETFVYAVAETLGFEWNISERSVCIPPAKKAKFLAKIGSWFASPKVSLKDTESLLGSLVHCALALPAGRSRFIGLSRFLASFSRINKRQFITRSRTARASEDVQWWHDQLSAPWCGSFLRPPPPFITREFFMDASTSFGIGVISDGHYGMWRLGEDWSTNRRDIGWAEIIAVEITLAVVLSMNISDASIHFWSDNQGIIGALQAGRSRNDEQNLVLRRIEEKQLERNIRLVIRYINTELNPADGPSRGIPPADHQPFPGPMSLDPSLQHLIAPVEGHAPFPCYFTV